MRKRTNRIIAGAIGGMVGGVVMSLALTAVRRSPLVQKINGKMEQIPIVGTTVDVEDQTTESLGKQLLSGAALGGIYGALRSALRLPGILSGPVYGLVAYGLSWVGLGPVVERAPGPWNDQPMGLLPRLVTHTVYGTVTDLISERVEDMLS